MGVPDARKRLRRLLLRFRRPLAAGLAGLAVILVWSAVRSPDGPRDTVLVAARDIPLGTTLTAPDLATSQIPSAYSPPGAFGDASALLGQVTATALRAGEAITDTRLALGALHLERGMSAVPIRLADSGLGPLLAPGARIDIVASAEDVAPRVLADDVTVLTVPRPPSMTNQSGTLVIVAVPRDTAAPLAAAAANHGLSAILR